MENSSYFDLLLPLFCDFKKIYCVYYLDHSLIIGTMNFFVYIYEYSKHKIRKNSLTKL